MAVNSFQKRVEPDAPQTIAELAPNVIYRAPLCGDETVRRALRNAFADFCRISSCFTQHATVPVEEGVVDYPILSRFGGFVETVLRVRTDFFALREGADYAVLDGDPVIVRLAAAPADLSGNAPDLRVTFIEQPYPGTENAPQWFIDRYGAALVSGALAEIYAMQGTPWYRPDASVLEMRRFNDIAHAAKMAAHAGANAASGRASALDLSNFAL